MYRKILSELERKGIVLNEQQIAAAVHRDGPCLVLAVPGSGKTTTMVVRIYMLIKYYNINPKNILAMTFSRASARDMKERFDDFFDDISSGSICFSTIHSFAYSVVRNYEKKKNIKYKFIEGIERDIESNLNNNIIGKIPLLKKLYRDFNNEYINDDQLEVLCNYIGYVKNKIIDKNDFDKYSFSINNFYKIFESYENYKRKNRFIDYDDMLTIAFERLQEMPELLKFYRNQYKYVLVDEGQDTSLIQHKIIGLLAEPNNNLFIVADDDQSIYGFRASEPKELLNFREKYNNAKIHFMEQNYRSTKNIVTLANEFIKCNEARYQKNLFTNRDEGSEIGIIRRLDEKDQARFLVKLFKQNNDNLSDIAVLYRNNISSVILIDEMERNNIPFYTKDSKLYIFDHWITQDIIAFINFATDNSDLDSFERIYYRTELYLSKAIFEYIRANNKVSVFDTLVKCPMLTNKQRGIIYEHKMKFDVLGRKKPKSAIEFIYSELKYKNYLKKSGNDAGYSMEGLNRILFILKSIAENTKSNTDFFERLKNLKDTIKTSSNNRDKNAVTLSTIHSSKGLEYNTVFIIDIVDGEFPSYDSIRTEKENDRKLIEEENRLFYVGITRAKNKLNLFELKSKNGIGDAASRYIKMTKAIINSKDRITNEDFYDEVELNVGNLIKHDFFGEGIVVNVKGRFAEVKFEECGIKKLDLMICRKLNIIAKIKVRK